MLAIGGTPAQAHRDTIGSKPAIDMSAPVPSDLSPEVQMMARDPQQKIAAIKLYRQEHPGTGLAAAKERVEDFRKTGR